MKPAPNNPKEQTIAAIARAEEELHSALERIEHLPAFDVGTVAFAAHALHNYLAVIDVTAVLLRDSLRDCGDADVLRWVDGLKHAGELMSHTANQLMGMSDGRPDVFKTSEFQLTQLVERGVSFYRRHGQRKNITIILKGAASVSTVKADRVALAAVLDNLVSNAVKYSPPGSTVQVMVSLEQGQVVCRVRDEGPGVLPEERERLFQRGVRLSAQTTGGEPSTGYGLAVAKELITKLGGKIWYESPDQGGACFAISLPLWHS